MKNQIINIKSRVSGIEIMNQKLAKICEEWKISKDVAFSMNLALEEIVTNIIEHGYKGVEDYDIIIRFTLEKDKLRIQIKDGSPEFNPFDVEEPKDFNAPVEEREIGGIGIHLVKKFTDNFTYRRGNNKNIITLQKNIE
ncbi:MAG: ATP-binding protein [Bacteroidales bacterium]|nr:ATP-binding protein [Bacteroidales bacterium]MBN2758125.1 ATP-binding protein [Bacteroidales bacterium]